MKKNLRVASTPSADDLAARRDSLEAQKRDLSEKLLYLQADLDNFRKKADREREELKRTGNKDLLREMIPIVQKLELSIQTARGLCNEGMATGLELILKQLLVVLDKFGMKTIDAVDCRFDPDLHELANPEECGDSETGIVLSVLRRGWIFEDEILQRAGVLVTRRPGE